MGRHQNPVVDTGPVGRLALKLRERHDLARRELGEPLTFREIARAVRISHTVLAKAESGNELPTWHVIEAMITHFKADAAEVQQWKDDHAATVAQLKDLRDADSTEHTGPSKEARHLLPPPITPQTLQKGLRLVTNYDELLAQLRTLRILVRKPSYRQIAVDCARATRAAGLTPYGTTTSSLSDIFAGRRRPKYDAFILIVEVLTRRDQPRGRLPLREEWARAFARAEYDSTLREVDARQDERPSNSDQGREGATAKLIADMAPEAAADLLAGMPPKIASSLIAELASAGKAQPILEVMLTTARPHDQADRMPEAPNVIQLKNGPSSKAI